MVELERSVFWLYYQKWIFASNSLHKNITFTYEIEDYGKIACLDVFILLRKNKYIKTTVYLKLRHYDIYLHWDSFTPASWK